MATFKPKSFVFVCVGMQEGYLYGGTYHKGLGRYLGAFPSDTRIFTTGNGPAGFNGPFNPVFRPLKFISSA